MALGFENQGLKDPRDISDYLFGISEYVMELGSNEDDISLKLKELLLQILSDLSVPIYYLNKGIYSGEDFIYSDLKSKFPTGHNLIGALANVTGGLCEIYLIGNIQQLALKENANLNVFLFRVERCLYCLRQKLLDELIF